MARLNKGQDMRYVLTVMIVSTFLGCVPTTSVPNTSFHLSAFIEYQRISTICLTEAAESKDLHSKARDVLKYIPDKQKQEVGEFILNAYLLDCADKEIQKWLN